MPAPVCLTELDKLYTAIMALQTGQQVISISFGERSVSYSAGQLPALITLYHTFWRQCGTDTGYPDLSSGAQVERGRPARYSMF